MQEYITEKQNNNILGLDVASRTTGYAIYKHGKIVQHGIWRINPNAPMKDLAAKILSAIQTHNITLITAENIYKHQDTRMQSAFDVLSRCQGVLQLISEETQIPLYLIDARQAKATMWGYSIRHRTLAREEQKNRMIQAVQRLGYELKTNRNNKPSDDEADAIGILTTFLQLYKYPIQHPQ